MFTHKILQITRMQTRRLHTPPQQPLTIVPPAPPPMPPLPPPRPPPRPAPAPVFTPQLPGSILAQLLLNTMKQIKPTHCAL